MTSVPQVGNTACENEKPYDAMFLPDEAHRLLALFRYWNVIEYFFPYKYTIGRDWNDVLVEFIPRFIAANDELEYHLTVLELATRIHDAHAAAGSLTLHKHFGALFLPVRLQYIDGETVVSRALSRCFLRASSARATFSRRSTTATSAIFERSYGSSQRARTTSGVTSR